MKRDIDDKLEQWKRGQNRKPLILRGARQVGKTYSLKAFGKRNFRSTHYINFEKEQGAKAIFSKDLNPSRIINELSFYLNRSIDENEDMIVFDEIQNCHEALTSLKYFAEDKQHLAVCAAGSLLGVHYGEGSFPVGKVDFLNLYPMSFLEFLNCTGEERLFEFLCNVASRSEIPDVIHLQLWNLLKVYFIVGGLPEVVEIYRNTKDNLFESLSLVRRRQEGLFVTYVADMAKHSGKVNAMHIERVWRNIPEQLAKEQDGSVSRFRFKGVIPGYNRFEKLIGPIDWLQAAGLIIKSYTVNSGFLPFSAYTKENSFKLYVFDVGMLGAISELPPKTILDYDYGTYKGYFAENFVAQEFLALGGGRLYNWHEKTSEVEFLREVDGDVFPIEVKSGWVTQAKSIKVFSQKYHPKHITILSACNFKIDEVRGVHRYPLYLASRFPIK